MMRFCISSTLCFLLAAGCAKPPVSDTAPSLPTTQMQIGSRQFTLEKATTLGEQAFGLMRRDNMPADHGMIFIYDHDIRQVYWNHDVRFPLDNLFVDRSGQIVSIQRMQAYSDASTNPVNSQYVIELNAGTPADVGIKVGDKLTLPVDVVPPEPAVTGGQAILPTTKMRIGSGDFILEKATTHDQ